MYACIIEGLKAPLQIELFLHVRLVLLIYIVDDGLIAILFVYLVAKTGCLYDGEFQAHMVLSELECVRAQTHVALVVCTRLEVEVRIEECVHESAFAHARLANAQYVEGKAVFDYFVHVLRCDFVEAHVAAQFERTGRGGVRGRRGRAQTGATAARQTLRRVGGYVGEILFLLIQEKIINRVAVHKKRNVRKFTNTSFLVSGQNHKYTRLIIC